MKKSILILLCAMFLACEDRDETLLVNTFFAAKCRYATELVQTLSGGSSELKYSYDSGRNLVKIESNANGATLYYYDFSKNENKVYIKSYTLNTSTNSYILSNTIIYTLDEQGRVTDLYYTTLINWVRIKYTYNENGYIYLQQTETSGGSSGQTQYSDYTYNDAGDATSYTLGNKRISITYTNLFNRQPDATNGLYYFEKPAKYLLSSKIERDINTGVSIKSEVWTYQTDDKGLITTRNYSRTDYPNSSPSSSNTTTYSYLCN